MLTRPARPPGTSGTPRSRKPPTESTTPSPPWPPSCPGRPLDTELRRRGETVYAPDAATPLHPEVLSHGAASLLQDAERPACLWTIDLDDRGEVVSARVERALVRSRARLTYTQVQAAIDGEGALPQEAPADLPELLAEIGRLRLEREAARGGITHDHARAGRRGDRGGTGGRGS